MKALTISEGPPLTAARRAQSQPNCSAPSDWLHFVFTMPFVGQPELSFMHVQSEDALDEVHAAGTFLQLPGVHAIVDESYESEQYSPVPQVALPQLAPPVAGGVVVVEPPGQSDAKLDAFAMSLHSLFSRHVSCSDETLPLQT